MKLEKQENKQKKENVQEILCKLFLNKFIYTSQTNCAYAALSVGNSINVALSFE